MGGTLVNDKEAELELAKKRAARYKKAGQTAEQLLETKSRELFDVNRKLTIAQKALKNDIEQATSELNVTNQRLQKSLEEKSNFIGLMSHEVRTPLNAIIGLSEILLRTKLEESQLDYITTINSGAGSLIVLLDDMLDITKIEAGRVELKPEPVDMRSVLKNVVTMFKQTASNKGLSLNLKITTTMPQKLRIDKGRYKQIVNNLINNAVKNTVEGGIVIQASYTADTVYKGVGTLNTRIIDSGVGIPSDKLSSIFNAYEQLGNATQGVGLGLSICQQLSELMMGKITCKSKVNQGSIFEVALPADLIEETTEQTTPNTKKALPSLAPLKILVAEDNPINQKVITAQLSQLGQRADIADNGQQAYEKLDQGQYDVLICDILMPVLDGEQTIRKIRASKSDIASSYCIALTASSFQNQRARLLDAGFDAFLSKPASLAQLADALYKVPYDLWMESPIINPFDKTTSTPKEVIKEEVTSFDFSYLKTQFGSSYRVIFVEIAPIFLQHAYQEMDELESSVKTLNAELTKRTSHSMKGAASSIGLNELSNLLLQIENKPSDPTIPILVQQVRQLMDKLKPMIEHELSVK